ncbi:prephenate dehydratase [Auraticoccus sp. F435]|uniref:Prephenate dehydratase n=1 Tax=Auraticoccus cholistanensis TaxID=2656650 RepID=A0A6A9UUE2_9ACTN|nr:prephenate dehydratase [Auraticoccus cholistanensis]
MTPPTHGYLGPAGTFTHQALLTLGDLPGEARPFPSVPAALHAVRSGEVEAVLVPIENSVEGGVSATLDALTHGEPLTITREVVIDVQFDLYVRPGTALEDVREVITHPHAAAQCRGWLDAHLPGASVTERGSTAAAAVAVADPASGFDAAICAPVAGRSQGLVAAAVGIADNPDAQTRFVLVSRPAPVPPRTGADKTTLVCFMRVDRSGALLEILEQFASRGVNLCRIESRPTRTTLGNYCFSIDAEGHLDDARIAEALMGLHRICQDVVFLGSYPRADAVLPSVAAGHADDDYAEAAAWLARLRDPAR